MRIQKNNFLEEVPNFMPNTNFTTLKLCYEGERLTEAVLDGKPLRES